MKNTIKDTAKTIGWLYVTTWKLIGYGMYLNCVDIKEKLTKKKKEP